MRVVFAFFKWASVYCPDVLQNANIDIKQLLLNCAWCLNHKMNIKTPAVE